MRVVLIFLAVACGQAPRGGTTTSAADSSSSGTSDGSTCGNLGAEYRAALLDALACDPAAADACTAWRPLSVAAVPNGGSAADARITGICWVAYVGYVSPERAASLDAIIQRYKTAGCTVGYCPGPSPHETRCEKNAAGRYTCGGS
ncbi:MAG: hypothetical protein ABR567_20735 [Myxococcales bacterium]|nr:hypothetical protein [Myxococcales bacterium]